MGKHRKDDRDKIISELALREARKGNKEGAANILKQASPQHRQEIIRRITRGGR